MLILPFVAIASLVAIGFVATRPSTATHTKVSGSSVDRRTEEFRRRSPYLYRLLVTVKSGQEPEAWLINEAMCEAYEAGNWTLMQKIQRRFGGLEIDSGEEVKGEESEDGSKEAGGQGDDIGKVAIASPFDGVPDDAWRTFVEKLATEKEDYKSDKHVGKFHHSVSRLSQLGIKVEDLASPDKQYEALVQDLKSSREIAGDIVHDYLAHPVSVGGAEQVITMSGIMGLLKAAGPQKARSWLTNPEDREKFPHTTKMFLNTNGVF